MNPKWYVHWYQFIASYWNFVQNNATDVLEGHRVRNRAMHPPNIMADEHQPGVDENCEGSDMGENREGSDTGENRDEAEGDEPSTQRARRYSKTPRNAEPKSTTMKYYPPRWQAVLEIAKNNMRKHVALVNAFPRRDRDLKEATLILNNTITEYQRKEGNILELGYFVCLF